MLPVVYLDVLLFTVLLIVVLVVGALVGWWLHRRRADHALDNDITAIQGHLAVLGQELPTDAERWRISRDAIEDATTQMRKHVERLRLIRLGIDETNLSVAPVDLARLIEHILIALEPFATQREITLSMNVQSLSARVSGDPQMFEEIFTTLLENAIKHNPPGTVVVAELSARDGVSLTRISDTGKGVSAHLLADLFEEGAADRQAGAPRGTGMGLYIARMLTELHNVTISLESELGKGSVFSVSLPLASGKL